MTTPDPIEKLVLPYAVTALPTLGSYQIALEELPPGVVLVRATWDGKEPIRYQLEKVINGIWHGGQWVTIIPAGKPWSPRSSQPIEIAVRERTRIRIQSSSPFSEEAIKSGSALGLTIIPTSPPA